jgi:hypothetical protein
MAAQMTTGYDVNAGLTSKRPKEHSNRLHRDAQESMTYAWQRQTRNIDG